jgi:hypothetical protein
MHILKSFSTNARFTKAPEFAHFVHAGWVKSRPLRSELLTA